jgi:hypothetical protein
MSNLVSLNYQSNLDAYNRALAKYITLTSKTVDEALEKKGKALGIALWRGFAAKKWAAGRNAESVLATMFRNATRLPRSAYRHGDRLTDPAGGQVPVRKPVAAPPWLSSIPTEAANGKMGAWRAAVAQEALRRKSGVGVLGASFLASRYASNSEGTRLVQNKTGQVLGSVTKGPGYIEIIGNTPGLSLIDERYGIVSDAIRSETADMDVYIRRRLTELWGETVANNWSAAAA